MALQGDLLDLPDYPHVQQHYLDQGWTDGLPIVPPTPDLVEAMLAGGGLQPNTIVGNFIEGNVAIDGEAIAVNAVMAGARPEYMPVIIAIIKAITHSEFGLMSVQASTGGGAVLSVVGGPISSKIGMNSGRNCFGPGNQANATIGRALRLIQTNVFSQKEGFYERSDLGRADKYTFCIAESDNLGPWPYLHEEMGCAKGSSGVTCFGGQSGAYFADLTSVTPERFLLGIARRMASLHISRFGLSSQVVVFNPDSHEYLVKAGWSKQQVREYLHEYGTQSLAALKQTAFCRTAIVNGHSTQTPVEPGDESVMLPITPKPEAILIAVAGGYAAKKASIIPSMDEYEVEAVPVATEIEVK